MQETSSAAGTWYYEQRGQRMGPVSTDAFCRLIADGQLSYGTLIWCPGMSTWEPVEQTDWRAHLHQSTPPPMTGAAVKNGIVWALAIAPFLSVVLAQFLALVATQGNEAAADALVASKRYWWIAPLLSIGLSYWDAHVLRKAGWDMSRLGHAWLVPVYLFRRAKLAGHKPVYFWVWVLLFLMSLF